MKKLSANEVEILEFVRNKGDILKSGCFQDFITSLPDGSTILSGLIKDEYIKRKPINKKRDGLNYKDIKRCNQYTLTERGKAYLEGLYCDRKKAKEDKKRFWITTWISLAALGVAVLSLFVSIWFTILG